MLLPSFLTLLLLTLQPVCLLYTQAVMESAAAQTARLLVTSEGASDDALRAFAQRRLAAVPNISIFHAGGPLDWDIAFSAASGANTPVSVTIEGRVAPLPVLGAFVGAFGDADANGDVRLKAELSYSGRPSWLEGSYDSWISSWK